MSAYVLRQLQVLVSSLGEFARTPWATILTVGVIGITLALPTLLYILVTNAEQVTSGWHGNAQISLFLNSDTDTERTGAVVARIRDHDKVDQARVITAEQALLEFKQLSGFGRALDMLPDNPLPTSIVVIPHKDAVTPAELQKLVDELTKLPGIDAAQLDMEWVQRFRVILSLASRTIVVLSVLLALAVTFIISNTIRLAVLGRREEIEIIKLIGGTDRFIRRPFLYSGTLQGLLGAIAAVILIVLIVQLLNGPVTVLAKLYDSGFRLIGLTAPEMLGVCAIGGGLGWLASRWSVGRHLAEIQPT